MARNRVAGPGQIAYRLDVPPPTDPPLTRTNRRALSERFESDLARALVARGLVSPVAIEEALNLQVVMGGALSTSLWDLGLLPSETATAVGAEIQRLKPAPSERLGNLAAKVTKLLSREIAARTRILPFALVDRTLHVASSEPWNITAFEQVAFATGSRLECYYLAEVPLAELLLRYYRVPLPARIQLGPQVRPQLRTTDSAKTTAAGELMDQTQFEAIYRDQAIFIPGVSGPNAAPPSEQELPEIELRPEDALSPDDEPITVPLAGLAEAIACLDVAEDRDAVGVALARFALSRGKRVALLVHAGRMWTGWIGAGESVSPAAVRALVLPAAPGSVFGLVGASGAPYLGPLAPHAVHEQFLRVLGGGWPRSIGLFPVHYRSRLSFGVYLDSGEGCYASPDLADILLLAQRVPAALARVVRRRLLGSESLEP